MPFGCVVQRSRQARETSCCLSMYIQLAASALAAPRAMLSRYFDHAGVSRRNNGLASPGNNSDAVIDNGVLRNYVSDAAGTASLTP